MRRLLLVAFVVAFVLAFVLACAGCSSEASNGELAADATVAASPWVVLDAATGAVTPATGAVDPADPAWRGQHILFRLLPAGEALVGRAAADVVAEADEHPLRSRTMPRAWIAVHELTQRQWLALAGTRPWLDALPVLDPGPWLGDGLPAFGLSPIEAQALLTRPLADGWILDAPEADEWERACLAGGRGKYAWGDEPDDAAGRAVCASVHPEMVGGREANAWGLHDMHGNVWELVRSGALWQARGGGWDQPVIAARASNRLLIADEQVAGWSVGLRPMLRR